MAHNSVPPGFVCRTSFVLKRVNTVEETKNAFVDASSEEPVQMDTTSDLTDMDKLKRQRPWILFDQSDLNTEESDCEQFNTEPATKHCLPKGVTHGCPDCSGCLKVTGRWRPEDARTDVLEEAPLFYPTEEEFEDTLKYVANIRARAEQYGICRIIPPPSWKPPCLIEGNKIWKSSTFSTHIQRIDGIRNQYSPSKMVGLNESPKKKRRRILTVGLDCGSTSSPGETEHSYIKGFETEPGQEFTLENFRSYAADFKHQYFRKSEVAGGQEKWVPSLENIDAEYKRIAENPTEEIEVLCGDNLETKALGSGFPTVSSDSNPLEKSDYPEYLASGWNLNNLPRLPGSLLSFESHDTCHILAPRTRVGMCFSSFHWKVEEHRLYSLSYLHLGAPKIWYGVPGKYYVNFEAAVRSSFPDSSKLEHPELHHMLVKQISPSALKSQGVPVFRCIQSPGEFVLVLPRAYHSGFDSGFNFSETACVAPLDWLPHGQDAVELYCEQGRRTSISHDKLLLGAAREAVRAQWDSLFRKNAADNIFWKDVCGKDGILTHAFKSRLKSEGSRRKYLFNSAKSKRMKSNFNVTSKRECSICLCDLHFSAVVCSCCEDRYSCLLHAKQLCSCAWSDKIFLYRHEICDIQLLVEALEGKFDAVYKWGKDDLGLTLHAHIPKNSQNSPGHVEGASDADKQKESISRIREEVKARILRSTTSNKSNSNDYPTGSLDSATATGNGKSSVSSIMDKVKAHALLRSTIFKELKTKENIVGPAIGTNTTGSTATLTPKVAAEGTTNNASLLPKEAIDMMEGTSDVSSASTSETSSSDSDDVIPDLNILLRGRQNVRSPPVKSNVPQKLPKGGRPADNYKASSSSHLASKSQTPRQPCPQSPILISDDSDG